MPQRARRPCAKPGCAALANEGRYCAEHQPAAKREDVRATANQRGYDARWQRLRLRILKRDPVCVDPFGIHAKRGEVVPSVDVDHIIAKRNGGRDEESNLRGLCHSCHSKVTAQASL